MTNVDKSNSGFRAWLAGLLSKGGSKVFFSDGQLAAGSSVEKGGEEIRFGSEAQGIRTTVEVNQIIAAQLGKQGIRFSITSRAVRPTGGVVEAGISNQSRGVQPKKK